jgi:hypothetical protein
MPTTTPSENTSLLPVKLNSNGDYNDKPGNVRSIRFKLQRSVSNFSAYIAHHTGRIGMLGSMSIAVNSLTGPAMLDLPAAFQRSGFIPTTVVVIFVCFLSSMCSLLMANTISKVERNGNFKREVRKH